MCFVVFSFGTMGSFARFPFSEINAVNVKMGKKKQSLAEAWRHTKEVSKGVDQRCNASVIDPRVQVCVLTFLVHHGFVCLGFVSNEKKKKLEKAKRRAARLRESNRQKKAELSKSKLKKLRKLELKKDQSHKWAASLENLKFVFRNGDRVERFQRSRLSSILLVIFIPRGLTFHLRGVFTIHFLLTQRTADLN